MKRKKRSNFLKRVSKLGLAAVITFVVVLIFAMAGDVIFKAGSFNISGDTIVGSDLNVSKNLNTPGNLSANYFIGNGSLLNDTIPSGIIVMWYGNITDIPSGWALCNGSAGTPNLANRFILGATSEDFNETGGATNHNITLSTAQLPSHTHTGSTSSNKSNTPTVASVSGGTHDHTGGTTNSESSHVHEIRKDSVRRQAGAGSTDVLIPGTVAVPEWTSSESSHTHGFDVSSSGTHSNHDITMNSLSLHIHTVTIVATGDGSPIDIRPLFYKLAYIMKL